MVTRPLPDPGSGPEENPRPEIVRELVLAEPRGFCAGVVRAIQIVERALERFGAPVYVKHAIVHNRFVVERLEGMGAVFVEDLAEVPAGAVTVFSAHGVAPSVHREAEAQSLDILDATCPLVTKVHTEARRFAEGGNTIFLVGHRDHVEVQGTLGEAPECTKVIESVEDAVNVEVPNPEAVAYLTQTTLSLDDTAQILDALRRRFPAMKGPRKDDICYATQNRQEAVRSLTDACDVILVIGSPNSSNSNRLVEVARSRGVVAHLIESQEEIDPGWLESATRIGITAGASAPESVVQGVVDWIAGEFGAAIRHLDVLREDTTFPLPSRLA